MIHRLRSLLAIASTLVAIALAPQALAQDSDPTDMAPIDKTELSDLRGGFFTVDGYTFDFGAIVRTTVEGQPALEQRLSWTPNGVTMEDASGLPAMNLPGIGGVGLDLSDATGTTLVGHRLVDGQLQGFIINSGSNRDIGQDIQINLTLPGFDTIQRDMLTGRLGFRVDLDMAHGLIGASNQ